MLVLTRRLEQSVFIDGDVVISVLAVDGDRVKLGISAPPHVSILREEVRHAVGGENRRAAERARDRAELEAALRAIRRATPRSETFPLNLTNLHTPSKVPEPPFDTHGDPNKEATARQRRERTGEQVEPAAALAPGSRNQESQE